MKSIKSFILLLGASCLFCSSSLASDILTLNNQMVFEGKIIKIKHCIILFKAQGKKYFVPADQILSLQFEDTADPIYTKWLKIEEGDPQKCLKGNLDAYQYHGKKGLHFALGSLFGPFAIIGTLSANPNPYNGRKTLALSENREHFDDPEYLACYKKKAKEILVGRELIGLSCTVVYLFIRLVILFSTFSFS
ncbi:MAG: hypothetical protein GDA51_05165 [Ekhidna sp.]|nr:hypothetical protein [Ekhidna sp.]MBC6425854.1 hypothetical protein [Ekhidna sp.]